MDDKKELSSNSQSFILSMTGFEANPSNTSNSSKENAFEITPTIPNNFIRDQSPILVKI